MNQRTSAADQAGSVPVYDSAKRPHALIEELIELFRYRDLVVLWGLRNITLRYKRSALGVLWTLIEPLMLMVILTVVFSQIFRFSLKNYSIYVLCGLLVFDFLSRSTTQLVEEIIASQNLAQRIHLPRSAFAVASVFSYLINWAVALVPLAAIMLFLGHDFSPALLALPVAMALAALFAVGLGLTVATIAAHFLDFKLTYNVLLNAWFYATPIIYPLEIVPEGFRRFFALNPLVHLIGLFRVPVYEARLPAASEWSLGAAMGFATAALGWWIFTKWKRAFDYRV